MVRLAAMLRRRSHHEILAWWNSGFCRKCLALEIARCWNPARFLLKWGQLPGCIVAWPSA